MPIGSRGHVPLIRLAASLNIDTQDRQDYQDEKLLHKKLTGSIIDYQVRVCGKPQCPSWPFTDPFRVFSNPLESLRGFIFCPLNRSFIALGGNLFSLPDLWRIPLEFSPTPSWPFVVLRGPSRTPFESFPIPWNPFADSSFAPLTDPLSPLVEIFSPFPTFGESLLSFLQPLSGPSSCFVALRGFLFLPSNDLHGRAGRSCPLSTTLRPVVS